MSGFDNGTIQGGVFFQAKQFGSILRGFGPPAPQAGVLGDLYIDNLTWQLFVKRETDDVDPWGHYLFVVPVLYRTTLKWFSTDQPPDSVGVAGDYCLLWSGFANYGMQPSIFGPRQTSSWPESGTGGDVVIAVIGAGTVLPVGLLDEGAAINESNSTQLVAVGVTSEVIVAVPVLAGAGQIVSQAGLQSGPAQISVTINPLYGAEDTHEVDATQSAARLAPAAPSVPILAADIEVGIDTSVAATVCPLPSVLAWSNSNPSGLELAIFDYTGHAAANHVTVTLDGTDVFTQGVAPSVVNDFGSIRLRPLVIPGGPNQWFIRSVG